MEMDKHIELTFKVIASHDAPDASVGYAGGICIEDVTLDDQSVFTGDIQSVIEKRIRDLEGEMMEDAAEHMRDQNEYAAEQHAEYICDMRRTENIIIGQGGM
jgi:hypothetical protein